MPEAPKPTAPATCPSCGQELSAQEAGRCAICKRAVHPGCLRPYGHHMLACEECRLATW